MSISVKVWSSCSQTQKSVFASKRTLAIEGMFLQSRREYQVFGRAALKDNCLRDREYRDHEREIK